MSVRPFPLERRHGDRRTSKEQILEIVIEGDPLTMLP